MTFKERKRGQGGSKGGIKPGRGVHVLTLGDEGLCTKAEPGKGVLISSHSDLIPNRAQISEKF